MTSQCESAAVPPKPVFALMGSHEAGKCAFLAAVAAAHGGELITELFDGAPMAVFERFVLVSVRPNTAACDVYAPIARAALVVERMPGQPATSTVVACAVRRGADLAAPGRHRTSRHVACNLASAHDITIAMCGLLKHTGHS